MSSDVTPKNSSASSANDKQVAGTHYKSAYQHWDFVCDVGLHYLLGCATKYVSRWRKKNGVEDLEKAIHYLEKAKEKEICFPSGAVLAKNMRIITRFCSESELHPHDSYIVLLSSVGLYDEAIAEIRELLNAEAALPTKAYVKQE